MVQGLLKQRWKLDNHQDILGGNDTLRYTSGGNHSVDQDSELNSTYLPVSKPIKQQKKMKEGE